MSVNDGTFSILEQVDVLFKRNVGKVSVDTTRPFHQETLNVRPAVLYDQIWAERISQQAPSDLRNLTDTDLDDSSNQLAGSTVGRTSTVDDSIKRYIKVQLQMVPGSNNLAYYLPGIFEDAIPFNHDPNGTYQIRLYKNASAPNNPGAEIPFGTTGGEWFVNHEYGTVTFYEYDNGNIDTTDVNQTYPPLLSFYKYIGTKGIEVSTESTQSFNGGDGTCGDGARAVAIDTNRCLGYDLGDGDCSYAYQIGCDDCGAWRWIVIGNGDGTTSLHIQYRTNTFGEWKTKFKLDAGDCDIC